MSTERHHVPQQNAPILIAWTALIVVAHVWGRYVNLAQETNVLAPPLFGRVHVRLSWRVAPAIIVAGLVVWLGRRVARGSSWTSVVLGSMGLLAAWAVALSFVDGADALTEPLRDSHDFLASLPAVTSVPAFLSDYARDLPSMSIHAQGHPPGALLLLWAMSALGLQGAGWAALAVIVAGASSAGAVLLAVRETAGEATARACAPWLILLPAAIWLATSFDALYLGVSAWGICLVVLATGRTGRRALVLAASGGVLLGGALYLSYGAVLFAAVALGVTLARGNWTTTAWALAGALAVAGAFSAGGFSWFDGLAATKQQYALGVASERPYSYFVIANLAALALALGPGVVAGLVHLRDRHLWLLCGGALAAVVVADLSGLFKGEVERIWLPFAPWLAIAGASFIKERVGAMLSVQAVSAIVLGVVVRSPW